MQGGTVSAAERLLRRALRRELELISGDELAGKNLADALDDAIARSLAVLQAAGATGDGVAAAAVRVEVDPSADEMIS